MPTVKSVTTTKTTSFRFTPEMNEVLDKLTTKTGLTRVAVMEAGARLLLESLDRTTPARAKKAVKSVEKSKQAP